ncbi:anti-sigma factor family protein [Neosynechococcus sphagnicola]|uniref:anti-sigma factor family protein n=1 Tax=Neosynechococcus sphagnicola TaxID=1501145 RepID=UPI00068E745A|nr:zf-HC2 domain-containing protein [Neosynechococcus sphagnicola]
MTSDFDFQPPSHQASADCFELLSAYLDGEVTTAERRQVESWLDTDPKVQRLYSRMLRLRAEVKALPLPVSPEVAADQMAARVFAQIDRRPRRMLIWGTAAAAIAATCVAAVAGWVGGDRSLIPNVASATKTPQIIAFTPTPEATSGIDITDSLMIALDQPVVQIPHAQGSESPQPQGLQPDNRNVR